SVDISKLLAQFIKFGKIKLIPALDVLVNQSFTLVMNTIRKFLIIGELLPGGIYRIIHSFASNHLRLTNVIGSVGMSFREVIVSSASKCRYILRHIRHHRCLSISGVSLKFSRYFLSTFRSIQYSLKLI